MERDANESNSSVRPYPMAKLRKSNESRMGGIHRLLLVLLLLLMPSRRNMLGHRGRPGELLEGPSQAGDVVDGRGGR